ncbi:hypothetical protein WAB17_07115 [Parerythrobacter aurantius]|uniref:hypothetical protein n=1 Tax=Parerythrobacter aurantius TaxID=3127706 RepID=UPI0032487955
MSAAIRPSSRKGFALAGILVLALAACSNSDDVSEDAAAENVEVTAEEALEDVTETPVQDSAVVARPEDDAAEEGPELDPVEVKSNEEQSEDAAALADKIRAELGQAPAAETPPAPAEPSE